MEAKLVSEVQAPTANTVFVLGAGFSYAVSPAMPLTRELTKHPFVEDVLRHEDFRRMLPQTSSLTFEQILDHVAVHAPWRSDADRHRSDALYVELASAVTRAITEREEEARRSPQSPGLIEIVNSWARMKSSVISLNYDLLVEAAYAQHLADLDKDPNLSSQDLYPVNLLPVTTLGGLTGLTFGREKRESFKLMKLHGSRNFVSQHSSFGWAETTYLGASPAQWDPASESPAVFDDSWLRPIIVPPTTLKSDFFKNVVIDRMWVKAGEVLKAADQVVIIGYSLPAGDLSVISMLREAVPLNATICVVNSEDVTSSYGERLGRRVLWAGDFADYMEHLPD